MPNREQALIDALFNAIATFKLEWDVSFGEVLSALQKTRTAIKRQMAIEGHDASEDAT